MSHSKTVLLIAFHYPPCAASSGLQRALAFSRNLRGHGWRPIVLTVNRGAYERTGDGQLADIPGDVKVVRAPAFDVARHLSIRGRYWSSLAVPDRWSTWRFTAVPAGMQLVRQFRPDVIWSTYPIATAHQIGAALARRSGTPWVADFRDPMVEYFAETGQWFPTDQAIRKARLRIEDEVSRQAAAAVFCTDAARGIFADRYPAFPRQALKVIPNGYDEGAFAAAEKLRAAGSVAPRRVLLHSGTIYAGPDRDPTALFRALRQLAAEGLVAPDTFELRLRDPGSAEYFQRLSTAEGVGDLVSVLPPVPYKAALAEMLQADGLLLLQGLTSNPAVPAKLYEYLRAGRPILGLVHPDGETASTLRRMDIRSACPLTDVRPIAALLRQWLLQPDELAAALPVGDTVRGFSREAQAAELARLLDSVARLGAGGEASAGAAR